MELLDKLVDVVAPPVSFVHPVAELGIACAVAVETLSVGARIGVKIVVEVYGVYIVARHYVGDYV